MQSLNNFWCRCWHWLTLLDDFLEFLALPNLFNFYHAIFPLELLVHLKYTNFRCLGDKFEYVYFLHVLRVDESSQESVVLVDDKPHGFSTKPDDQREVSKDQTRNEDDHGVAKGVLGLGAFDEVGEEHQVESNCLDQKLIHQV